MKKFIIAFVFLLVFAAGFIFRDLLPAPSSVFQDNLVNPSPSFPPKKTFTVVKVLDGDTVIVESGEAIRYLGIDAPEKNGPLGISAGRYNEGLVLDKKITLEFDYETYDQFGRLLGYVWLDNLMVNEKLIEEGYAKVYTIPKTRKLKYWDRLIKAKEWAKEHHNGMWLENWVDN